MDVCARLKYARKKLGLTQKDIGISIGLKAASIRDLESGKVKISTLHALALEYIHKINSEWLLNGHGEIFIDIAPKQNLTIQKVTQLTGTGPTHDEIITLFEQEELAREINWEMVKLEKLDPSELLEVRKFIKYRVYEKKSEAAESLNQKGRMVGKKA